MRAAGFLKLEQPDFLSNYAWSFKELRQVGELFDVTLACGDETIEAHKVILAACSPFFRRILRKIEKSHPFIYLKGIFETDLKALLEYIYTGQTQVPAEDVDRFLKTAQELKIKGLVDEIEDTFSGEGEKKEDQENRSDTDYVELGGKDSSTCEENLGFDQEYEQRGIKTLRNEISSRMIKVPHEESFRWKCTECGFKAKTKTKMGYHVETHLEGFTHTCIYCGRDHKTRVALKQHIKIKHKDLKKESEEDSNNLTDVKQEIYSEEGESKNDSSVVENIENDQTIEELDESINDSLLQQIAVQSEAEKLQNVELKSEILKRMKKIDDDEQGSMWKCTECDKVVKKKTKLEVHVETHLEGFTHTCVQCGKVHKTRAALKLHIYSHHKVE